MIVQRNLKQNIYLQYVVIFPVPVPETLEVRLAGEQTGVRSTLTGWVMHFGLPYFFVILGTPGLEDAHSRAGRWLRW